MASHYRLCFGCGPDHPTGLHIRVEAGEGLSVVGRFTVTAPPPGRSRSGPRRRAVARLRRSPRLPDRSHRTASGHRPAADLVHAPGARGSTLYIAAHVTGMSRRKLYTMAEGRLERRGRPVGASASALFVTVPGALRPAWPPRGHRPRGRRPRQRHDQFDVRGQPAVPLEIQVRRLDPDVPLPAYAHPGDAGADLVTTVDLDLAPGELRARSDRTRHCAARGVRRVRPSAFRTREPARCWDRQRTRQPSTPGTAASSRWCS